MTDDPQTPDFGAGRLALTDARLALLVLNHARYAVFTRVFGVPRAQVNLLSLVVALGAAEAAAVTAHRVSGAVRSAGNRDVGAAAAFALREAGMGVAGPQARDVPGYSALLALGVLGGLALPATRRAARRLRAGESRVRLRRASRYAAAGRAATGSSSG